MYKVGEKINIKNFDIVYPVGVLETKEKEELSGIMYIDLEIIDENDIDKWSVDKLRVNNKKALMQIDFSNITDYEDIELVDENDKRIDYILKLFDPYNKHIVFGVRKRFVRDGTTQLKILCGKNKMKRLKEDNCAPIKML
ncbi:MAG: hypothetical protein ACOCQR_03865 [bacterium]